MKEDNEVIVPLLNWSSSSGVCCTSSRWCDFTTESILSTLNDNSKTNGEKIEWIREDVRCKYLWWWLVPPLFVAAPIIVPMFIYHSKEQGKYISLESKVDGIELVFRKKFLCSESTIKYNQVSRLEVLEIQLETTRDSKGDVTDENVIALKFGNAFFEDTIVLQNQPLEPNVSQLDRMTQTMMQKYAKPVQVEEPINNREFEAAVNDVTTDMSLKPTDSLPFSIATTPPYMDWKLCGGIVCSTCNCLASEQVSMIGNEIIGNVDNKIHDKSKHDLSLYVENPDCTVCWMNFVPPFCLCAPFLIPLQIADQNASTFALECRKGDGAVGTFDIIHRVKYYFSMTTQVFQNVQFFEITDSPFAQKSLMRIKHSSSGAFPDGIEEVQLGHVFIPRFAHFATLVQKLVAPSTLQQMYNAQSQSALSNHPSSYSSIRLEIPVNDDDAAINPSKADINECSAIDESALQIKINSP